MASSLASVPTPSLSIFSKASLAVRPAISISRTNLSKPRTERLTEAPDAPRISLAAFWAAREALSKSEMKSEAPETSSFAASR